MCLARPGFGWQPRAQGSLAPEWMSCMCLAEHCLMMLPPVPLQLGGDDKVLESCLSLERPRPCGHRGLEHSHGLRDLPHCLHGQQIKLTTLLAHKV